LPFLFLGTSSKNSRNNRSWNWHQHNHWVLCLRSDLGKDSHTALSILYAGDIFRV